MIYVLVSQNVTNCETNISLNIQYDNSVQPFKCLLHKNAMLIACELHSTTQFMCTGNHGTDLQKELTNSVCGVTEPKIDAFN